MLVPLPTPWLQNVVEIHADATHASLVDFNLAQVRCGVGETRRRTPVVLPKVGTEAVPQGPVDGLGVGRPLRVGAPAPPPTRADGEPHLFLLLRGGAVVDRRMDRGAERPARGDV